MPDPPLQRTNEDTSVKNGAPVSHPKLCIDARSSSFKGVVIVCAALSTLLTSCSQDQTPDAAISAPPTAKVIAQAEQSPLDPTAKMSVAEGTGQPGQGVDVKYSIKEPPQIGKLVDVRVAFIPRAGVDSFAATIMQQTEGITITGNTNPQFNNVQKDQPYQHTFSFQAKRAGAYVIAVDVVMNPSRSSEARAFSIPITVKRAS